MAAEGTAATTGIGTVLHENGPDGVAQDSGPVVVPTPSWPKSFRPQQWAAAVGTNAQVCPFRLTAAKVSPPATSRGLDRVVVVPSPSWPRSLDPQQYPELAVVTPQVC